jgi:DNA-binding MarR family transcriptional regulator
MKKKSLIDPTLPLGYTLSKLTKPYYGAFTKYMEQFYELDKHFSILMMIESTENQCTQQYICNQLNLDKVSMVRILDHLDEKGYIKRVTNPEDRRERWIQLTPKAVKELPHIREAVMQMNDKAFEGFKKTEREEFYRMMQKVYDNVIELPAHPVTLKYSKKSRK